jgi:hypothetical protein
VFDLSYVMKWLVCRDNHVRASRNRCHTFFMLCGEEVSLIIHEPRLTQVFTYRSLKFAGVSAILYLVK